jgi:cytochrome c
MNSFEINKIAAAILVALLLVKASDLVSEGLVDPKMLEKQAFEIEGVEVKVADGSGAGTPVIESIAPLLAAANIENGKKVFKKCTVCHSIDKGGPNKVGPNLYGIVGSSVAQVSGFAYSAAMSSHGGNWDYKNLNDYLYKPRDAVKGTKMAFAGLSKVQDRADVIAYMRQESDSPQPLPVAGVPEPSSAPLPAGESKVSETAPSPAGESESSKTVPSAPAAEPKS